MILLALRHLFLWRIRYVIGIATLCSISTTSSYTAFFFLMQVLCQCFVTFYQNVSSPLHYWQNGASEHVEASTFLTSPLHFMQLPTWERKLAAQTNRCVSPQARELWVSPAKERWGGAPPVHQVWGRNSKRQTGRRRLFSHLFNSTECIA